MRCFLASLFLLAVASTASGQPLELERVEAPARIASGDAVEIALTAHVRRNSDDNERYTLTVFVGGTEHARWTSPEGLRARRERSVPLAWTQAVRGTSVRGRVALLDRRGKELAREDFEIAVAGGESVPTPVISVPVPRIERRPRVQRPSLVIPPTAPVARPINPVTSTTAAMRQIDLSISETVYFHGLSNNTAVLPRNRYLQFAYIETTITNHLDEEFDGAYTLSISLFKPDNGDRWIRTYRNEEAGWLPAEPFGPNESRPVSAAMGWQIGDQPSILPYDSRFVLWIDVETPGDVQPNNNRVELQGRLRDTQGFGGTTLELVIESRTVGPVVTPDADHIFR